MTEVQTILHALKEFDLEPTQIELMDAYWLGAQIAKRQPQLEIEPSNEKVAEETPPDFKDQFENIDDSSSKQGEKDKDKNKLSEHSKADEITEESSKGVPIYAESSKLGYVGGLDLRIQAARALPNALELARALKPLMRQIPSTSEKELDIPATITNIAEMRLWTVVLKPKLEKWLDIALVVDNAPSMLAWEQSVLEFRKLLQRQGGFGNVSLWHLDTSHKNDLNLYDHRNRPHPQKHLLDIRARQLIIIISDCVAPAWQGSAMQNLVAKLGKKNLVTLLQVLSRNYWSKTLLGNGQALRVQARSTVTNNKHLQNKTKTKELLSEEEKVPSISIEPASLPLPIITFNKEYLQVWSKLITAKQGISAAAVILHSSPEKDKEILDVEALVNRFRATAEPLSFDLICNLAASPSLCLPVMRLVQESTLPESTQLNLAEVLLGGLLKAKSDSQMDTTYLKTRSSKHLASDFLEFQFVEGVQEQLLKLKLVPDVAYIFRLVSRFLKAKHLTDFDFEVFLDAPEKLSSSLLDENKKALSIAEMPINILRRLGGRYEEFLQNVEERKISSEVSEVIKHTISTSSTELNLKGQGLTDLPLEVFQISTLTKLDVSYNRLTQLPPTIKQLTNLKELNLSFNELAYLPPEITQLTGLKELKVDNNPLTNLPPEIAQSGVQVIFRYLEELTKGVNRIYEANLFIVGEERAGKTSLVKSLTNLEYALERDELSTEGIDIQPLYISKEETGLEKDFRLNIWDFGGQEIYHATHQFFLREHSIYLLVTETRKDIRHDDLYYWLNIIRLLSGNSPVLIVQNKSDQPLEDIPLKDYKESFSNIVGLERTSCMPHGKETIYNLQKAIAQIISTLPHIGAGIPQTWTNIREELFTWQKQVSPIISYKDYINLCQRYGMDEERSNHLADFFHDLGTFLHFKNNLYLRRNIFLDKEWIVHGIYSVLDSPTVIANSGEFSYKDLDHLWKSKFYSGFEVELIELMREFKICYPLEGKRNHYLAPHRLPKDTPENLEWDSNDNLHLEYRYRFMPKGMLAQFIVERYKDISGHNLWRYGVLLELDHTFALIQEDYFNRKVIIRLRGENKRDALGQIRSTFEYIHNNFNNLIVEEMLPCHCSECSVRTEPFFYSHNELNRYLERGIKQLRCGISLEEVSVQSLLDSIDPKFKDTYDEPIKLTGKQFRQLTESFTLAFPSRNSLDQMLTLELDKRLNNISKDSNLLDIVFTLVETAEIEGWVKDLILAARKYNPNNPALLPIAQELGLGNDVDSDFNNTRTKSIKLTKEQLQQLHKALLATFPKKAKLDRMLAFGFEKRLSDISKDDDLQDIIFTLIEAAETEGWLLELISAARKENPKNVQLLEVTQELGLTFQTLIDKPETKTNYSAPITILFLAANPQSMNHLALDKEVRDIDEALRKRGVRDAFNLVEHWAVSVEDLQEYLLRHNPDIVHFSGHGSSTGELYFVNDLGKGQGVRGKSREIDLESIKTKLKPLEDSALAKLFEVFKDTVKCVVLNACYANMQAQTIYEHIPCVIGTSRALDDNSAIAFSKAFYRGLGSGKDASTSFEFGKNAIDLNNLLGKDNLQILGNYSFSKQLNPISKPSLQDKQGEILWVDDRPHNNIFERQAFESMNLNITLALSTNEALKKLSKKEFDVIISDMGRLEGPREGYVLLDTLRQQGNQTPFFIYAGSNALEHKLEIKEHGGQGTTNHFQELSQMVISAINSSELDNQTSLDKATIFPIEKILSKEECIKIVCEEIKNLLTPSSASLVRRAISKTILETYQKTIDDPIGIAEFIVNLHNNESKQYAHSIVEELLVPAIKKFDPLKGDFYNELKQDNNSTNKTVKELFYLLLGWIVHIAVADQEYIFFDQQSETFDLAVSTKIAVEVFMARFSGRNATFVNHAHPKDARGQGSFDIDIERLSSTKAEETASKIAVELWNKVYPENPPKSKFSLTDEEKVELAAQIESKRNAKGIYPYIISKISPLTDKRYKEIAKELTKLIPNLAFVRFGGDNKTSILSHEYELVASIQTFSESLEETFPLEVQNQLN